MKKILILAIMILIGVTVSKADLGLFHGVVTTDAITNLANNTVTFNGTATLISTDPDITVRGFVWSTSANPTTSLSTKTVDNGTYRSGSFSANATGLSTSQTYYARAYITNTDGTFYGNQITFTTIPTLPEWALIGFGCLVSGFGGWFVWRRVV